MKWFLRQLSQILLLPLLFWPFLYRKILSQKKLSYLSITIAGNLSEAPLISSLLNFLKPSEPRYYDLLLNLYTLERSLKKKKLRKEVKAILVHIDSPKIGWARAWELRRQLAKIANFGIPIWAFLHSGDRISYYIATACTAIATAPATSLELFGFSSEQLFYKQILQRFGIKPNFISVGDYKTAAETYTRSHPSTKAKEQLQEILTTIHEEFSQALREKTGVANPQVFAKKALVTTKEAFAAKLIDMVCYPEQLEFSLADGKKVDYLPLEKALKLLKWRNSRLVKLNRTVKIAMVVGEGIIVNSEQSMPYAISLFDYEPALRELKQAGYKAILYRWNSPGGSAYASDMLWQCMMSASLDSALPYAAVNDPFLLEPQDKKTSPKANQTKKNKPHIVEVNKLPVYVSMSDVAASGGYYLSAVSKRIYASPLTITGSIGVVGGKFNLSGLANKIGIQIESINQGENSNLFSAFKDFSPEQKQIILHNMQYIHQIFQNRIALARELSPQEVQPYANGKIFSGKKAKQTNLIDGLASLTDLLEQIRSDLKLKKRDELKITILPQIKAPLLPTYWPNLAFFREIQLWHCLAKEHVFALDLRLW